MTGHPVERVARASYGRLLAALVVYSGDLVASEDALAEAFARALQTWPARGVPARPEAWLLAVARNRLRDEHRHLAVTERALDLVAAAWANPEKTSRDERLGLLMLCADPGVDPAVSAPLMLQTVLGLDAARIASAWLVSPASMAKRLGRAKADLARRRVAWVVPEDRAVAERLPAVLDALYAAFTLSSDEDAVGPRSGVSLRDEVIDLAELVVASLPGDNAEALGLLALCLYTRARDVARTAGGGFVPLDDQDTSLWDRTALERAEGLLRRAAACGAPGRFQFEAAIQSCHVARRTGRGGTWAEVVLLYEALVARHPTVGAWLGLGSALGAAGRPEVGLAHLDRLDPAAVREHQPAWAVRADLLGRLGRHAEARVARERAAALAVDPAVRAWLAGRGG